MFKCRDTRSAAALIRFFAASLAVLCTLQGCTKQDPSDSSKKLQPPQGGILIRGAGATFPAPLYKRWFELFHAQNPLTVISYEPVGSGEGIRRFIGLNMSKDEKVDFGASDAAMSDDEIDQVKGGVVLLPVTAGSVVLAYNLPEFKDELRLSRKAYAGIFSGEIKRWNDPIIARCNPGKKLPNFSITTVVRQDKSGTTFAFTNHLNAISEEWRSLHGAATLVNWPGNAMRATGNEGVAGRINQAIGSIGYVSYEFARSLRLKLAVLENRAGNYIAPDRQSCTASLSHVQMPENMRVFLPDPAGSDSYPIVTFSWILLYRHYEDQQKAKTLHELFKWCLSEGQKYADELGYVELPQGIVSTSLTALERIGPVRRQSMIKTRVAGLHD